MPFKLLGTIIVLVVVTIFCGFNLDNKCNVSFGFYNFENVSVFITVMISFFAGILITLPFAFFKKRMTKEQIQQQAERIKTSEEKSAAKAEKAKIKAETKEKTAAEKKLAAEKKSASAEKTVFDFKIRRPVKAEKSANAVPKIKPEEKTSETQDKDKTK